MNSRCLFGLILMLLLSVPIFGHSDTAIPDYYGDMEKLDALERVFLEPYVPNSLDLTYQSIIQEWLDEHIPGFVIFALRSRIEKNCIMHNLETGENEIGSYIYLLFKMSRGESHEVQFCVGCIWKDPRTQELQFRGMYTVGIKYGI